MKVVIKKRVSLDFLGEEYKEAYLVFRAMPISDFEQFQKDALEMPDEKAIGFLLDKLKANFLSGKFPGEDGLEDIKSEDLDQFDAETITKAFQAYTGVNPDPKDS